MQTEIEKTSLNHKKQLFTLRVIKHWDRFCRETVESPSLETFETDMDKVLSNWL